MQEHLHLVLLLLMPLAGFAFAKLILRKILFDLLALLID